MAEAAEKQTKAVVSESDAKLLADLNDLLKKYTPAAYDRKADTLETRYKIELSQPLPEFNTRNARAYAANDAINRTRPLFALICAPNMLPRHGIIAQMKLLNHPHLMQLIAAGPVNLSQPEETRFVLIYARPAGRKLSEVIDSIAGSKREYFLNNKIIAPIASAIDHLSEFDLSPGRFGADSEVRQDRLYLGTKSGPSRTLCRPQRVFIIERSDLLP